MFEISNKVCMYGGMKVAYINHMGDDNLVVDAARVSMSKSAEDFNEERNEKLIKYLAKHGHWTPFGHPQITLFIECPIFVARQDFKHQIGFVRNEISRRYVDESPEFYEPENWRKRPEKNIKQGSSENIDKFSENIINDEIEDHNLKALYIYNELIDKGICPEQARMMLPQSMFTSYYTTGSLAAWARAYNLRSDSHAQKEIQFLAKSWGEIISELFPVSWKYLTNKDN